MSVAAETLKKKGRIGPGKRQLATALDVEASKPKRRVLFTSAGSKLSQSFASRETRGITLLFFFSSRRRHTSWPRDWSSDVCSSDLAAQGSPSTTACAATATAPVVA